MKTYSYLALGDSYTIGEQVTLNLSFPYLAVQLLRKEGFMFNSPEIIATTGWTTNELKVAIEQTTVLPSYNIVSLLIGVNNQYQGGSVEEFRLHFRFLLEMSIKLANGTPRHVMVMSIPDWGVTPFAAEKNKKKIGSEIDTFNFICQAEAEHFQARFINITKFQREDGNKEEYLAADLLHPSGKEYAKWAEQLKSKIIEALESS